MIGRGKHHIRDAHIKAQPQVAQMVILHRQHRVVLQSGHYIGKVALARFKVGHCQATSHGTKGHRWSLGLNTINIGLFKILRQGRVHRLTFLAIIQIKSVALGGHHPLVG